MSFGFEEFAQNATALGDRWRQQRREKKIAAALTGFESDPQSAIAAVRGIDPVMGYNMGRQHQSDQAAQAEAAQKQEDRARTAKISALHEVVGYLRPVAMDPNADLGAAYDSIAPIMRNALGMSGEDIAQYRDAFTKNPSILNDLEHQLKPQVMAPGSQMVMYDPATHRSNVLHTTPYADTVVTVPRGDGGRDVVPVPRTYGGGQMPPGTVAGPDGSPLPVQHVAPAPPMRAQAGTYTDPKYAPVEAALEQKYGLPSGLMSAIRTRGERSNPDQVSTAGARTVYQVTPQTRALFLNRYGVDAYKDEQSAAEVAALHLRDDIKAGRDPIRGYIGGPDRRKWGPQTEQYAQRVTGGGGTPTEPRGGPQPLYSTPGKPEKPEKTWRQLTPQEVTQRGLEPTVAWQASPEGEVKPIGGAKALPGRPAQKQLPQDQLDRYQTLLTQVQSLRDTALSLKSHPGLERDVGMMSYLPNIRGGKAADFDAQLETLKSKVGFSVLQTMRDMSKTGGALGNISNYENKILQNNLAALQTSQSPDAFRKSLDRIVSYTDHLIKRYQDGYRRVTSPAGTGGQAVPREAQDMLRGNPTPKAQQQFDSVFGAGAAAKVLGRK